MSCLNLDWVNQRRRGPIRAQCSQLIERSSWMDRLGSGRIAGFAMKKLARDLRVDMEKITRIARIEMKK